ncbi:hypothetical protein [Pseudomonas sp. 24 E 1]|nr:hypothetical protein [Pseudomonas sp. 24 E 1]
MVIFPWMGVPIVAKPTKPNTTGSANTKASGRGSSAGVPKKPANQYLLPTVKNATTNNTLYPIDATAGTTVTCPSAIPAGTQITLSVAIKGQEANPVFTAMTQGTGAPNVEVNVPAWVIGYCIGLTVIIWYKTAVGESFRLELFIEVIKPDDMPVPRFTDLSFIDGSWWLDMATFPGDAGVELCDLPFIAAGQRIWFEAVGNEHHAQPRFFWILENHVVTEEEAQSGFCFLLGILRAWLAENDDYSSVTTGAGIIYSDAEATAPEDPRISRLPGNAQLSRRATANLRVREPELTLYAPTIREAVYVEGKGYLINPANTVNGAHVVVAYDGIKPGDKVCVELAGTPGPGTPVLACQVVQQGETSLLFGVPASAISANFGKPIKVSYTVLRGSVWPSSELLARVLEPTGLSGIDVDEKTGGKICLNTFPGDATVRVSIWDYIALGQTVCLWITGELGDGSPFHWDILTAETVKSEWVTAGVSAALIRDELEKLADCQVFQIHFSVSFSGSTQMEDAIAFLPLSLEMVQKDLELVAPSVREAVGNLLTVWNGRDGVTVRVAYDGMCDRHTIALCWEQAGGCLALVPQPGDSVAGYVDFHIPRAAVIHGIGKTVPIRFSVVSRCKHATSPDLELEISVPVCLPTPVVPQATPPATQGGILDLASFPGDASITVSAWWFALAGHHAWLKCTGTNKDGSPRTFYAVQGRRLTHDEVLNGLAAPLIRAELDGLKHDSSLTVTCLVASDGSEHESGATIFPALKLTIKRPLICGIERFESLPLGTFGVGGSVQTSLMKITFASGSGVAGIVTYANDEFYSGKHFVMCENVDNQVPPQLHRIDFVRPLESVKFAWAWKQQPATVVYYDEGGKVITSVDYPDDWRGGFWVEHVTEPGTAISWLTILVRDYSFIDNFHACYRD